MLTSYIPHNRFVKDEGLEKTLCPVFWGVFIEKIKIVLQECMAMKGADVGKLARKYFDKCRELRSWALSSFTPHPPYSFEFINEWKCIVQGLSYEILRIFHKVVVHGNSVHNLKNGIDHLIDENIEVCYAFLLYYILL